MPNIRIERVPIQSFYLGYFGFDHLQLAFEQDSLTATPIPQDEWYVLEGTRVEHGDHVLLGAIGIGGRIPMRLSSGGHTGAELESIMGTPEWRGSRVIVTQNAQAVWDQMAFLAAEIHNQQFDYNAHGGASAFRPTLNSTSLVSSLLDRAGLDVPSNMPRGLRISPGSETLLGTTGDDHMVIHAQFTALFGGLGQDLLEGTNESTRIDRLYGGGDNDILGWSHGINYLHGGDSSWAYAEDGFDTVDYSGAGNVHVEIVRGAVEHRAAQYIATHDNGQDYLFSIERLIWSGSGSDNITTGPGLEAITGPLSLQLGAQAMGDRGDVVDLSQQTVGMNITRASSDAHYVTFGPDSTGAIWMESAEWIIAGDGNDTIHANTGVRGIEAGDGDDFIDAHLTNGAEGAGPQGYDLEIVAGAGDDTIVGAEGRTLLQGGAGSDRFVIAAMTDASGSVEYVITDAEAGDTLFVPYNYFNMSGGDYEGSALMPVLGAIGTYADMAGEGWTLFHEFRLQEQIWTGTDETAGVIPFAGAISFQVEGSDLLIRLYQGQPVAEEVVIDDEGNTQLRNLNILLPDTETIIRVIDYQQGDLGLQFIDPGTLSIIDFQGGSVASYSNWDAAVGILNQPMLPAFAPPPSVPSSDPNDPSRSQTPTNRLDGTGSDDLIAFQGPARVEAGAGNDTIASSGSGNDVIDGGTGADQMAGGEGNDRYYVDNPGDIVIEALQEGLDTVVASVDHALADNIENLTLAGAASLGIGNGLDNQITGNAADNVLHGGAGSDFLFGEAGNDILIGGSGSDTYAYARGTGADVILEEASATGEIDTLVLHDGIAPSDLTALRDAAAPDDLIFAITGGGRITIADALAGGGAGIEQIVFDDGTVWDGAQIAAVAASAPLVTSLPPEATDDGGLIYGGVDSVLLVAPLVANDIDHAGGGLTVVGVSDLSVGTASINADGNIAVSLPVGYEGPLSFRYTIADVTGATSSATVDMTIVPNTAPVVGSAPVDQSAAVGAAWSYALPQDVFTDAEGDGIDLGASLADGSALPAWLAFDANSGVFSATPPGDAGGSYEIRITAFDGFVFSDTTFTLTVAATGDADQTLASSAASETLVGGSGNDTFLYLGNDNGLDVITGGLGFDVIVGSPWNDTIGLANVAGNLDGIEAIDGGTGTDTLRLTDGADTLDLSAIAVTGIELIDAGAGNDTVTGSAGDDTIRGGAGDDMLSGGAGDDTFTILGNAEGADVFVGGAGFDTILGSAWNDTIRLAAVAGNLEGIEAIDGGGGYDILRLSDGADTLDLSAITFGGVELIDAGAGNDTVTGSAGNVTIRGGAGDDILAGGAGDDTFTILGNAEGADVFVGGAGFDTILGSAWNDTIRLAAVAGNLEGIEAIDGGGGYDILRLSDGADTLDLSSIAVTGIELIDAGAGNDTVTGSAGNDTIRGGAGDDILAGGAGDDTFTILGNAEGSDVFMGGAGFDVIRGSAWNDTIGLAAVAGNLDGIEAIDGGTGADTLRLSDGADTLDLSAIAVTGIELIDAGAGNDTVTGSAGNDTIRGGAGLDTFVFVPGGGHDTILDFASASVAGASHDVINVSAYGLADYAALSALMVDNGIATIITLGPEHTIALQGVSMAALGADDFLLA